MVLEITGLGWILTENNNALILTNRHSEETEAYP